jgi:predicted negative regulator of RcsB-dependent stress response
MPTVPPPSRDATIEAHLFWHRFKSEIAAVIVFALLAIIGFAGYRFYSERQESNASALLASAKKAPDYQQVIERYPGTNAGGSAYLLLAQAQRNERKFAESNATLQQFIDKHRNHELVTTAQIATAANLESMGKTDEALSLYQQIAANYPASFNAPLALISQVPLLKAKNQPDAARRVCETIMLKYRASFWANDAMRELRSLKPSTPPAPPKPAGTAPSAPGLAPSALPQVVPRPPIMVPTPTAQPPKSNG